MVLETRCDELHRVAASRLSKSSLSDCKDTKNYWNRQMFWQEIFKNNLKEIICKIKDVYAKK
jgi:hypothetical protein